MAARQTIIDSCTGDAESRIGIEHRPKRGEFAHSGTHQQLRRGRGERAGGHRQGSDQAIAREYPRAVMISCALRQRGVLDRYENADVAGRWIHRAEKGHGDKKPDLFEGRERDTGCDHQDRAGDQQTAKIVARRNQSNAEGQDSGTEQSRRGNQSDLRGIEPDPGQIDRKHDGGKAIAKAAQCARAIEEQEAVTRIQRMAFVLMIAFPGAVSAFGIRHFVERGAQALASFTASSFAQKCMK